MITSSLLIFLIKRRNLKRTSIRLFTTNLKGEESVLENDVSIEKGAEIRYVMNSYL